VIWGRVGIIKADKSKDYLGIKMAYKGTGPNDANSWSCEDGYATSVSNRYTYTPDSGSFLNCMANTAKSTNSFKDNKAYLIGHWMKEFDPSTITGDSTSQDYVLSFDGKDTVKYSIDLKITAGGVSKEMGSEMTLIDPTKVKDGAFKSVTMTLSALASLIVLSYL